MCRTIGPAVLAVLNRRGACVAHGSASGGANYAEPVVAADASATGPRLQERRYGCSGEQHGHPVTSGALVPDQAAPRG